MSDTLMSVVAIFLAVILMFIFPLIATADRSDDLSQQAVQTATTEFIDNARSTGRITEDKYDAFLETLSSTGNQYKVDLEVKSIDTNARKKTAQVSDSKVGENQYVSKYNTQILDEMQQKGAYTLKEGDIVKAKVSNTNKTMSQLLQNFFYKVSGNSTYTIGAEHAGIVNVNG